jgi:very-short-patch-repair endonuclease
MVFSSLRSEQIDLRRTRALGVRHLKAVLDYAERGPQALAEAFGPSAAAKDFEAGFEQAVCDALTARGLEIDTQVGCAGYRVDLAVRDPDEPGRYLLGIECDGAAYNSAKTARDRDRLRQSVLEGLGWKIEHIWSTEWRINPQGCVTRITDALEKERDGARKAREAAENRAEAPPPSPRLPAQDALDGSPPMEALPAPDPAASSGAVEMSAELGPQHSAVDQQETGAPPEATSNDGAAPPRAVPSPHPIYRHSRREDRNLARADIFDPRNNARAVTALARIVQVEAPIVPELAMLRLADWFGVKRLTERTRRRLEQIIALAQHAQLLTRAGDALWPPGAHPEDFKIFRAPGPDDEDSRDLEHIPLVERINAVSYVLREQFGMPRADLVRETARLLGSGRVTDRVRAVLEAAVDACVASGHARSDGGSNVTLAS